jgi:ABC-type sugar transport system substrate-binding protein
LQFRLRSAAATAAVAATCAVTVGCGGNDKGGTAATAASSATPAVTGTTPVTHRTIGIIGNTFTSEILKRLADDEKATVEAVGWKAIVVDGQATPDGWNSGFDSLIAKKVDAILVGAIEAAPIQKQLDRAKQAGIPVFATALDVFPDSAKHMIVVGESTPALGKKAADLIAQRFPQDQVLAEDVSPVWAAHAFHTVAVKDLTNDGVKVAGTFDVDLTDLVNSMAKGAAALAQAHPAAKVYLSCCDFGPPILATAFQQINRNDITVVSRSDDPSTLKLLKAGQSNVVLVPDLDQHVFKVVGRLLEHFASGKPLDTADDVTSTTTKIIDKTNNTGDVVFPFQPELSKELSAWGKTYKLGS